MAAQGVEPALSSRQGNRVFYLPPETPPQAFQKASASVVRLRVARQTSALVSVKAAHQKPNGVVVGGCALFLAK